MLDTTDGDTPPDRGSIAGAAPPLILWLVQAPVIGPESCVLTGLCSVQQVVSRIPSGVMFTAVGLVGFGAWLWRRRRGESRRRES